MSKSKSRKKRPPKRVLALPDLEHAETAVLNSLDANHLVLITHNLANTDSAVAALVPAGWSRAAN